MSAILVTGINGFVGGHLAVALNDSGIEVSGIITEADLNKQLLPLVARKYSCDLTDDKQVSKINLSSYDAIIHLAGLANVGLSYSHPELYMKVNVVPLINLCKNLLRQKVSARLITISSGTVYDNHQPIPFTETSKLAGSGSPYVMSKIAMEKAAKEYIDQGIDCVIARPFNHTGPGQNKGFLVPDLFHKIQEAKRTGAPLLVGNLATRRDYTDVRDVVKAYISLATNGSNSLSSHIYNICSNQSHSGEEILKLIRQFISETDDIKVEVDSALIRPDEPVELRGDNSLIQKDTGWTPSIPFQQTLKDSLV